eukprot:scaffold64582_cov31-Prasinocladus_malaysianus.AAC.1
MDGICGGKTGGRGLGVAGVEPATSHIQPYDGINTHLPLGVVGFEASGVSPEGRLGCWTVGGGGGGDGNGGGGGDGESANDELYHSSSHSGVPELPERYPSGSNPPLAKVRVLPLKSSMVTMSSMVRPKAR